MSKKGASLENNVAELFRKLGYSADANVNIKDKYSNNSEIDVIAKKYLGLKRRYVECKDYSHIVPLKEVAKFKEVLSQNKISKRKALFIYNGDLSERCKHTGIKVLPYKEFKSYVRKVVWGKRALLVSAAAGAYTYHNEIYQFAKEMIDKF